jgi:CheY-like chemotaxis protein
MPGEDGYSLIGKVRQLKQGMRTIPAIALTAYAGGEDRKRALEAGFDAYIAKPFDSRELLDCVAVVLSIHKRKLVKK